MCRAPASSAGGSVGMWAWGLALAQVHTVSPGTVRPQDRPLAGEGRRDREKEVSESGAYDRAHILA